jgi:hypothetical protein
VIAKDDDECFDLIFIMEYEYDEYYPKLRENIVKAEKFALAENEESRVVEAFTT